MAQDHRTIADAVVTALNGHTFTASFTATRGYAVQRKREDLTTLTVTVIPAAVDRSRLTRAKVQADYAVDVSVQKAIDQTDLDSQDTIIDLADEIRLWLKDQALTAFEAARYLRDEEVPGAEAGYLPEHILAFSVMSALFRVYYRVVS